MTQQPQLDYYNMGAGVVAFSKPPTISPHVAWASTPAASSQR